MNADIYIFDFFFFCFCFCFAIKNSYSLLCRAWFGF